MLACLEAAPESDPRGTLLCLHGYPESSHMFAPLVGAAAGAVVAGVDVEPRSSSDMRVPPCEGVERRACRVERARDD